jgi:hypothetical protein
VPELNNEALDALRPEAALDQLHQVLETHKELIRLQAEGNQLKTLELEIERAKVEAQQRELDLKEKEVERERQTENARSARFVEVIDRYANLGEQVAGLIQEKSISDSILREGLEAFSGEVRIIKRGLYALLSRDGGEIQKVKQELRAEFDREEVQELLIRQRRNLAKLKQREAKYGGNAPLEIQNQIEDVEAEILRLETKLTDA